MMEEMMDHLNRKELEVVVLVALEHHLQQVTLVLEELV